MRKNKLLAALGAATLAAGCGQGGTPRNEAAAPPPEAGANQALDTPAPPPPAENAANTSAPDLSPPPLTPEAERGVTGARNILLSFARAIELKQFEQARALLSAADRQKWNRVQFAAMFADLDRISVAVPDGAMEGAAGSSYYTAPVTVTATAKDGRPVRLEGEAILRLVNDVDGATEAQRRWHFERLTLDWTH